MHHICERCRRDFESPRPRRWCSATCRVAANKLLHAQRGTAALEILRRMTGTSDPVVLAALEREARRLLAK